MMDDICEHCALKPDDLTVCNARRVRWAMQRFVFEVLRTLRRPARSPIPTCDDRMEGS